ncbi:MAG TPA: extracellular solute-binding protein, partial [Anaerolineales bacterium]|nr:extracellular solute-binding protein [Anaerolineales bacterium]
MKAVRKPILTVLSLVLVFSILLTGCAPAATAAPTDVPVVVEPTAAPVVAEPTDAPVAEPTDAPTEAPAPTDAPAAPAATLTIWADDTRAPILQAFAEDFLAKYNVELIVEDLGVVQDIRTPMITAAPAGEGPDIFIGVHDWLGALVESGLVTPIDLGDKEGEFVQSALDAFTYTDGQLYGVP